MEQEHWTCAGAIWNLTILFYPTNSQFTVKLILSFYNLSKTFFVPCWQITENICQLKLQSQLYYQIDTVKILEQNFSNHMDW